MILAPAVADRDRGDLDTATDRSEKVVSSKPDFATDLLAHAMIWLLPKRLEI